MGGRINIDDSMLLSSSSAEYHLRRRFRLFTLCTDSSGQSTRVISPCPKTDFCLNTNASSISNEKLILLWLMFREEVSSCFLLESLGVLLFSAVNEKGNLCSQLLPGSTSKSSHSRSSLFSILRSSSFSFHRPLQLWFPMEQ